LILSVTPNTTWVAVPFFLNPIEVCLYFVTFCDKTEAHRRSMFVRNSGNNIASRCAFILSHFAAKHRYAERLCFATNKALYSPSGVLLFWHFCVPKIG
jgi:uncharacterized membrane protein